MSESLGSLVVFDRCSSFLITLVTELRPVGRRADA